MGTMDDDYLSWDGTESVTLKLKRSGGTTSVTVSKAMKRALSRDDLTSGGVSATDNNRVWNLPVAQVGSSNTVRATDTITDSDSAIWTVRSAQLLSRGSRWRCVCSGVTR